MTRTPDNHRPAIIRVLPHIARAIDERAPVVALESSVFAQGLPIPENRDAARRMVAAVEVAGAVAGITAIAHGTPTIGLRDDELERFLARDGIRKVSARDIPVAMVRRHDGATTVAAAVALGKRRGIRGVRHGRNRRRPSPRPSRLRVRRVRRPHRVGANADHRRVRGRKVDSRPAGHVGTAREPRDSCAGLPDVGVAGVFHGRDRYFARRSGRQRGGRRRRISCTPGLGQTPGNSGRSAPAERAPSDHARRWKEPLRRPTKRWSKGGSAGPKSRPFFCRP